MGPVAEVLITGAGGQLGQELSRAFAGAALGLGHDELDVSDAGAVARVVRRERPRLILHAAAWTDVDGCERDPERAWRVNVEGSAHLGRAAAEAGAQILYISTDYVFGGDARAPIPPDAPVAPRSTYGRSKLGGELAVQSLVGARAWIVRTSWVFGARGRNFPRTILTLARQGRPLRVVDDQVGCPTYARDLAGWLERFVSLGAPSGTYHAANAGACSWHEFAQWLVRAAGLETVVERCSTGELGRPAPRPAFSVLNTASFAALVGPLRHHRDAALEFLREMEREQ